MYKKTLSILGIPVEILDAGETIEKLIVFIEMYRKEHEDIATSQDAAHYVSILTAGSLANVHGWSCNRQPELLNVLRQSAVVTVERSIAWLSKCLGNALKEWVVQENFIPLLIEFLAEKNKSLFLLGDEETSVKKAAVLFQKVNPDLKIVGIAWPKIHVKGELLVEARERDTLLLEQINEVSPDVLLINLETPKQEIWFQRVSKNLDVPVSIGVDNTLRLLTRKRTGLPKKIPWEKAPFLFHSVLLVAAHYLNHCFSLFYQGKNIVNPERNLLFLSEHHTIAVVRLPKVLDTKNAASVNSYIEEAFSQETVILDFHNLRHFDGEGLGLLVTTALGTCQKSQQMLGFGLKRNVRLLMQLHKVWDLFSHFIKPSSRELHLAYDANQAELYESIEQKTGSFILSFFGKLDGAQNFDGRIQKFLSLLQTKNCIIDLTYCYYIDNSGFSFLLKLKQIAENNGKTLKITGLSKTIRHQFRWAGMRHLFM